MIKLHTIENNILTLGTLGCVCLKIAAPNIFVRQFFIVDYIIAKYFIATDTSIVDIFMLKCVRLTINPCRENYFHDYPTLLRGVNLVFGP